MSKSAASRPTAKLPAASLPQGKPVVLYLRRSTSLQDQSIASQRDYLKRYAAENGLEVVGEYVDDAVSGTSAISQAAPRGKLRLSPRR